MWAISHRLSIELEADPGHCKEALTHSQGRVGALPALVEPETECLLASPQSCMAPGVIYQRNRGIWATGST